jgi:hypothetical protein
MSIKDDDDKQMSNFNCHCITHPIDNTMKDGEEMLIHAGISILECKALGKAY